MAPRAPARVTAARSGRAHVVRWEVMRPSSLIVRAPSRGRGACSGEGRERRARRVSNTCGEDAR